LKHRLNTSGQWADHLSREINDTHIDSQIKGNDLHNNIIITNCLKCDIRIVYIMKMREKRVSCYDVN